MTRPGAMEGQICLVTGASRGIGFHTARGLALKGAHVILVGHHAGRGAQAQTRIREAAGNDVADFVLADLTLMDEVRSLAETVRTQHPRLDVLVNNAGGFFYRRHETDEGLEKTFALNHLAPFLLTHLLLDRLKESAPARVVNISSATHRNAKLDLDNLQLERGYTGTRAYGRSKLALTLFTYELARRLEGTGVTANAVHPGFVNTDLGKQHWWVRPFLDLVHKFMAMSPEEGAETPFYVASSSEVAGLSGKYFVDKEPVPSSLASYDEDAARRLWQISERLTGLR